jgi:hypothetical protein
MAPSEFSSIHMLLESTDNHELEDHNLHMWRSVRGAITGTRRAPLPEHVAAESGDPVPRKTIIVSENNAEEARRNNPDALIVVLRVVSSGEANIDPKDEAANMLGYAWGIAPHLPALLGTVARAADSWRPQEHGAIGAAISSRQQSPATEYVRAFAKLLGENMRDLELTAPIFAAMAGAADVVLNDANNVLTADAVRKALTRTLDNST